MASSNRQEERLALISSFTTFPLIETLKEWDDQIKLAEIYMLTQAESFLRDVDGQTVMETMGNWTNYEIRKCAGYIWRLLKSASTNPKQVRAVSMASYFPTLCWNPISVEARLARNAISACYGVAHSLNQVHVNGEFEEKVRPKIEIIEIVGGSRLLGIWPAELNNAGHFDLHNIAATLIPRREAIQNLAGNLELVVRSLGLKGLLQSGLRLAVELEPGDLFALNGIEQLHFFVEQIDRAKLRPFVGLNLDIAHWRLAGISPNRLLHCRRYRSIRDSIIHCHFSGNHRAAHFGDLDPFLLSTRREYKEWRQLYRNNVRRGLASGIVAIELECIKSKAMLHHTTESISKYFQSPIEEG